jgi:hypothetical protein
MNKQPKHEFPESESRLLGFFHAQLLEQDGRCIMETGWVSSQTVSLGESGYLLLEPLAPGLLALVDTIGTDATGELHIGHLMEEDE